MPRKGQSGWRLRWMAVFAVFAVLILPAHALVVAGVALSDLTSAPADDPGWANVGNNGVYLGNFGGEFWVLTARHVGAGSITFGSSTYGAVANSSVIVKNSDNSNTDLLLFRISSDPGLPTLDLASSHPNAGSVVTTIGDGSSGGATQLFWSVNTNGNTTGSTSGANWSWTLLPDATGSNASGYAYSGSGKRYGFNTLDSLSTYNVGTGLTTAYVADFDAIVGESQGAPGDSGGAVFFKNGSNWELVGIMGAVAGYNSQPGSTAVFGNVTYYASVPVYYSFIADAIGLPVAVPEPADFALAGGALVLGVSLWRRRRA